MSAPDRGIWAAWYDLPAEGRGDYFAWLHGERLPALAAQHMWAAHYEIAGGGTAMDEIADRLARPEADIGAGTQFVALVGAASPHDFFAAGADPQTDVMAGPLGAVPAGVPAPIERRVCVFAEEARVLGPEIGEASRDGTPGPAIQMGSFRTKTLADEFDLAAWYTQYRFPAMAAMAGAIRTRKLVSVAGWAKHSVMYEFTSLDARAAHFQNHESLALDETVWTNRIINYTIHAPGSPSVAKRVWP